MTKEFTVGRLKELLKDIPDDTLFSIEDMNGNAFYTEDIAEHLDCDYPSIEFLIPIYITKCSIEEDCEKDVFLNQDVEIDMDNKLP